MTDNWKHKSENMLCKTCMYFVIKKDIIRKRPTITVSDYQVGGTINYQGLTDEKRDTEVGRCRRHAPTMSGWPVMFASDWCGDHKLDEAKI
jgi:hypothetical protein